MPDIFLGASLNHAASDISERTDQYPVDPQVSLDDLRKYNSKLSEGLLKEPFGYIEPLTRAVSEVSLSLAEAGRAGHNVDKDTVGSRSPTISAKMKPRVVSTDADCFENY